MKKLMVQSYNNGGAVYNAETEEAEFRHYSIDHEFGRPAECNIILADPKGLMLQKYNAAANAVYLGVGKITVEDPAGTDMFFGRLVRAIGNSEAKTLTLECRDWLDQLDEKQIIYEMREDLDGAGLRQYQVFPDYDNADVVGINPAAKPGGLAFIYFKGMNWAVDQHNNKFLVFTTEMAGPITVKTGPYTYATTAANDIQSNDIGDLWTVDGDLHNTNDPGAAFTTDYSFRVWVNDSGFHSSTTLSGATIHLYYEGGTSSSTIELWNGGGYDEIAGGDSGVSTDPVFRTINIPDNLISGSLDASGVVKVRFNEQNVGGGGFVLHYIMVEYNFVTTGYSTATQITDGISYRLVTGTDFSADATRVWHGLPMCIAKPIYLHIESATGPILGGDGIVTLICGAANVENTSGLSTRQYKETTRLKMAQDLAIHDQSVFWITLGGVTVTWKQTFGADTMQLTDGKVESWQSLYDYKQMTNEYHVYGARIGSYEIFQSSQNAASILKYKATRSKVLRNPGLVTEQEAKDVGTALAARDAEISQMVGCTILGNTATAAHATTIKLGEIVEITSSYLWPTAAKDYVVTRFAYDSNEHKTFLTLHPKSSIGYQEVDAAHTKGQRMEDRVKETADSAVINDPVTHVVS